MLGLEGLIAALVGLLGTAAVKVLSDKRVARLQEEADKAEKQSRARELEIRAELSLARDRIVSLEKHNHSLRCILAQHGLSSECPKAGMDQDNDY